MKIKITKWIAVMAALCSILTFTACGSKSTSIATNIGKPFVFKIGSERAEETEFLLYLTNIANKYEKVYGTGFWELKEEDGTTMLDKCKNLALAQLAQVKAMKLLAKEKEIVLSEEENAMVLQAAQQYMDTLSSEEKAALGIEDISVIQEIYCDKFLADKLYLYLIRDVNPEISDDEARIITVQHILLKTYTVDDHGNRTELDAGACSKVLKKAEEILEEALDGESFESLTSKYNEDSKSTYSFGKGDMEEAFEKVAFDLAKDEISKVVRTSQGYHIMKCISTLDREQTDLNKEKLLISRKQQVFGETYNQFVAELKKQENKDLIQNMVLPGFDVADTMEMFEIYESQLGNILE